MCEWGSLVVLIAWEQTVEKRTEVKEWEFEQTDRVCKGTIMKIIERALTAAQTGSFEWSEEDERRDHAW